MFKDGAWLQDRLIAENKIIHVMQIEIEKFFTQIGVRLPNLVNCGQYFKHFTSVKYDPRVVKWAIF